MRRRQAYDVMFKMEVIAFAEKCSNREAGRKFNIDESMVRRWRQNKSKLELAYHQPGKSKQKKKLGAGRNPCLSTIEDELMDRIAHEREQQHVSCKLIQLWAQNMAHENGIVGFRASRGWLCNFLRRFNLTIRKRTAIDESLPADSKEKGRSCLDVNKDQRNLHESKPMVAIVDKKPICDDIPSEIRVD